MTHPAIYTLPFILQLCYKPFGILQRVTKSNKVHISIHGGLQKLHKVKVTLHSYHGFPLYTKLFKQLANLSLTDSHHLVICTSGEDRMMKITSI